MPAGVPVGALAIGRAGAVNAALLSAAILALFDAALDARLDAWRAAQTAAVADEPDAEADACDLHAFSRLLEPGATIGILGGGQLGRMLALAAARLGLRTHVFAPEAGQPGLRRLRRTDHRRLRGRGGARPPSRASVDVVTYEFENVPARTAALLSDLCPVRPSPAALAACQDRLVEKEFLAGLGIPVAGYMRVDDAGAMARAVAQLGRPSILKTRRFGYDGKGQALVREGGDLAVIFRSLGGAPAILESVVPFSTEISVVAARGRTAPSPPMTSAKTGTRTIS